MMTVCWSSQKTNYMKRIILIGTIIPFLAFQCKKDKGTTGWLEGKVVRSTCASFVLQISDNDDIGQDGWKDIHDNDKEYNDVIAASNPCDIPSSIRTPGMIVRFKLKSAEPVTGCVTCDMYDAPPTKVFDVKGIFIKD